MLWGSRTRRRPGRQLCLDQLCLDLPAAYGRAVGLVLAHDHPVDPPRPAEPQRLCRPSTC